MSDRRDDWLGLESHGDGRWSLALTPPLARHDAKLYGGTGIAAAVAAMEAETERDAVWVTVQFAGTAEVGERIELQLDVLANGKRTSQVRITATAGGRIVLAGVGATGVPRTGPVEVEVPVMPRVAPPDECDSGGPMRRWHNADELSGWTQIADMRHVPDGTAVWARMREVPQTRPAMAFLADMVPTSVVRAAGMMGAGTSLDNSMRFGRLADTDWILLDMDPWLGTGGYLHGAARVWSEDGTLLGVASQTASAMVWEGEAPPWLELNR